MTESTEQAGDIADPADDKVIKEVATHFAFDQTETTPSAAPLSVENGEVVVSDTSSTEEPATDAPSEPEAPVDDGVPPEEPEGTVSS